MDEIKFDFPPLSQSIFLEIYENYKKTFNDATWIPVKMLGKQKTPLVYYKSGNVIYADFSRD